MKGFKTLIAGLTVAVLGVLETLDLTQFSDMIPDPYDGLVFSAVGTLMIALRLITNTPVAKK